MNRKRVYALLALAVLAVVTRLLVLRGTEDEQQPALPEARSDYLLENFSLVIMNDAGQRRFSLTSPHLERSPIDDSTLLTEPDVLLYEDNEAAWRSMGDSGWISPDGTELRLEDNVWIRSLAEPVTLVESQSMAFLPDERLAQTADPVTLTQAQSVFHGTGMRANFEQNTWELLADVQARFTVASD